MPKKPIANARRRGRAPVLRLGFTCNVGGDTASACGVVHVDLREAVLCMARYELESEEKKLKRPFRGITLALDHGDRRISIPTDFEGHSAEDHVLNAYVEYLDNLCPRWKDRSGNVYWDVAIEALERDLAATPRMQDDVLRMAPKARAA